MICKECGCDTLIEYGDLLLCPLCGKRYYNTGIDFENSITNQLEKLGEEQALHIPSRTERMNIPVPEPAPKAEPVRKTKLIRKAEPARKEEPVPEAEPAHKEEPVPEAEPAHKEEPVLEAEPVRKEKTKRKEKPTHKEKPKRKEKNIRETEPAHSVTTEQTAEPEYKAEPSETDKNTPVENISYPEENTKPAAKDKSKTKKAKEEKPEKKKKSKLRETINFFIPIVAAAIIATIIKTFIIANAVVPTGSMIPTINEKDRIIASRLSYKSESPKRYDIVMFAYPDNEDTIFVKRILGLPGDTINVVDGKVFITKKGGNRIEAKSDFVNQSETPYGNSGPFYVPEEGEKITTDGSYCYAENGINVGSTSFLSKYCKQESDGSYTVSEKLYFAIGDNINHSMDSRAWMNKYVAESKILGKVIFKYYPKFEKFD